MLREKKENIILKTLLKTNLNITHKQSSTIVRLLDKKGFDIDKLCYTAFDMYITDLYTALDCIEELVARLIEDYEAHPLGRELKVSSPKDYVKVLNKYDWYYTKGVGICLDPILLRESNNEQ